MSNNVKFRWIMFSDDGRYNEKSVNLYDTQEECYTDMRDYALIKIKWNIDWVYLFSEDTKKLDNKGIVSLNEPIGCSLIVNADKIIYKSYSGEYTFMIEKVVEKWNPRFKCNDIIRKGTVVAIISYANENATNPEDLGYRITIVGHTPPKWNEWTKDDEHWISAEDESNWSKIGEVTMDVENGDV